MANLTEHTAKIGDAVISGGRRAEAADFAPDLEGAGKSLQATATKIKSDAEEDESRKSLVAYSQIRAQYAKELDEAALSGADLAPIKERMQSDLGKVGENFSTKKGVDQLAIYTANADLMFDEQSNHINVQRAAADATLQGHQVLRSTSTLVQQNPGYLQEGEAVVDAFMKTYEGKLSPAKRAEMADTLKKELNVAAAASVARSNPDMAIEKLKAGEWNLDAHQREQAIDRAKQEQRAKRAEDLYVRNEKEYQEREADEASFGKHLDKIMKGDLSKSQRAAILDDPTLKPQTKEHLVEMMEQRAKALNSGEGKSDPATKRDLWLKVMGGQMFNSEAVVDAVRTHKLSLTDGNQLVGMVANLKDENNRGMGARVGALVNNMGRSFSQAPQFTGQPELVAEIQNDYTQRVMQKVEGLRKENKDPNVIFDPKNKDYVGSKEFIAESVTNARQARKGTQQDLEVGAEIERDGFKWKYKGGDRGNAANWTQLYKVGEGTTGVIKGAK